MANGTEKEAEKGHARKIFRGGARAGGGGSVRQKPVKRVKFRGSGGRVRTVRTKSGTAQQYTRPLLRAAAFRLNDNQRNCAHTSRHGTAAGAAAASGSLTPTNATARPRLRSSTTFQKTSGTGTAPRPPGPLAKYSGLEWPPGTRYSPCVPVYTVSPAFASAANRRTAVSSAFQWPLFNDCHCGAAFA